MNVIIANKYKDMLFNLDIEVIKSKEGLFETQEIVDEFKNFYFDRMIIDITALKNAQDIDTLQKLSVNLDKDRIILFLDNSEEYTNPIYLSKLISIGIFNFTANTEGVLYLMKNPNHYRDVAHLHLVNDDASVVNSSETVIVKEKDDKIIGVVDLTPGAGASTFIYMLKKELEPYYSTCVIEVDKNDLHYFDMKDLVKTSSQDLPKELMKNKGFEVTLVDLNDYSDPEVCSDVLYLVEPSIIKLSRLVLKDRRLGENHKTHKIILNKSFVKSSDLNDFEYETKMKVFANIPCLNDRDEYHDDITKLLISLGFGRLKTPTNDDNKNKLLGMFKI